MPRKAKEIVEEIKKVEKPPKKVASKKVPTKKESVVEKKKSSKLAKAVNTKLESVSVKKQNNSKKDAIAKSTTKKTTKKTTAKTSTSKKKTTATTKTTKKAISSKPIDMLEYYDLPYRYNQTIVKILAQTPKMLFVYWDISEKDRQNYITQYGNNFFDNTVPFLRIKNQTDNYTFDIDVDDFANSWYLPISDSKCTYSIELFRKNKPNVLPVIQNDLFVTSSNELEVPNDHILFEKQQKMVYFKNVRTDKVSSKNISNLTFIKNIGKIYNIYELYQEIYKNEEVDVLSNPSSNPSSDFIVNNLN